MVRPFLFALYINEFVNMCKQHNCPSINVDNDMLYFQLLMYADDICIVNDTVGRLQNQLNVLGEFCSQYGLDLSKSKVVVFRNGGSPRHGEKFNLND
jgi:hypothetical protein